jgi:hypothetical protein
MKTAVRTVITLFSIFFIYPNLLAGPVITLAVVAALIHYMVGS